MFLFSFISHSVVADFNELQVEIPTSLDDLVLIRAKLYSSPDTAYQYRDIWRERHKHCMVWAAGKQVQVNIMVGKLSSICQGRGEGVGGWRVPPQMGHVITSYILSP